MNKWVFITINGLIVLYLIYRLITSRKDKITPLSMETTQKAPQRPEDASFTPPPRPTNQGEKPLNCFFQYNGETWDAFEILGLPAGSSKEECLRAYNDLKHSKQSAGPFLEAAWVALQHYFSFGKQA